MGQPPTGQSQNQQVRDAKTETFAPTLPWGLGDVKSAEETINDEKNLALSFSKVLSSSAFALKTLFSSSTDTDLCHIRNIWAELTRTQHRGWAPAFHKQNIDLTPPPAPLKPPPSELDINLDADVWPLMCAVWLELPDRWLFLFTKCGSFAGRDGR